MNRAQAKEDRNARRWKKKKRELLFGISAGLLIGLAGLATLFILRANFEWWAPPIFLTIIFLSLAFCFLIIGMRQQHRFIGELAWFLIITGFGLGLWGPFGYNHLDITIPVISIGLFFLIAGYVCGRAAAISEGSYLVKPGEKKFFWLFIVLGILSLMILWFEWRILNMAAFMLFTAASMLLVFGFSGFVFFRMSQEWRETRITR